MQLVDNMNIFYVALTRAVKSLHIIAAPPSKTLRKRVADGTGGEYTRISDFLFAFAGGNDECSFGEAYDFTRMERRRTSETEDFEASYPSIDIAGRLSPSTEALDFFGDDGEPFVSPRINGIVLHEILSAVSCSDDVDAAVASAHAAGKLSPEASVTAAGLLKARVSAHPDWFPGEGVRVCVERAIIGPDGRERRPDRVVFTPDGVVIVDFKFGKELPGHVSQVREYASLYAGLGCKVKAGVVWYVMEDKCVFI